MNGLDWTELGRELRRNANDAWGQDVPDARDAYGFLLANPWCFGFEEWPANMPQEANIELIAAYYGTEQR